MSTSVQSPASAHSSPRASTSRAAVVSACSSPRDTTGAHPLSLSDLPLSRLSSNPNVERSSAKRTAYLPLLSPSIKDEEDGTLASSHPTKRRRVSTPNALTNTGTTSSNYFEVRRLSAEDASALEVQAADDLSNPTSPTSGEKEDADVKPTQKHARQERHRLPIVALPNELAHSILKAFDMQRKDGHEALAQEGATRQHRAKSVPHSMRSSIESPARQTGFFAARASVHGTASATHSPSMQKRRESIRAQHLALLASQARLASTGATSITTAIRAENAVKGAVWKAVEDVQLARQARQTATMIASSKAEDKDDERAAAGASNAVEDEAEKVAKKMDALDPTAMWSEALADSDSAISFLDTAKEVAREWANGFYAYEKEWVCDALMREQKKLDSAAAQAASASPVSPSTTMPTSNAGQDAPQLSSTDLSEVTEQPQPRRVSASAPPAMTAVKQEEAIGENDQSSMPAVIDSPGTQAAKWTLLNAHRKLSSTLPIAIAAAAAARKESAVAPSVESSPLTDAGTSTAVAKTNGERLDIGGSGKLVDVLSNFATLIDSRKEGCHSLELLAQNARRLSAVQLPQIRNGFHHSHVGASSTPVAHPHESSNDSILASDSSGTDSPMGSAIDAVV